MTNEEHECEHACEHETKRRRLSEDERREIVDEVYNRFYLQVGNSAIRSALYVFWAAVIYAGVKLGIIHDVIPK